MIIIYWNLCGICINDSCVPLRGMYRSNTPYLYQERNYGADINYGRLGHGLIATSRYHNLAASLEVYSARDRHGFPNFRFP